MKKTEKMFVQSSDVAVVVGLIIIGVIMIGYLNMIP